MKSKIKLIPKPPRRTAYEGNMTRTAKTPERNNINNTPNKLDLFQKELYSLRANQNVTNNKLDKLNEKISQKISHNTVKLNEQSTLLKSMATALNQQTYLLGSIKKSIDNLSMNIQAVLRRLPKNSPSLKDSLNNSPSLKDSLNNSGNTSFSQKSKCSAKYNRRNNRK